MEHIDYARLAHGVPAVASAGVGVATSSSTRIGAIHRAAVRSDTASPTSLDVAAARDLRGADIQQFMWDAVLGRFDSPMTAPSRRTLRPATSPLTVPAVP